MFDENEFLSPFGLRSLSRYHRDHPLVLDVGGVDQRLDYEPAESTTPLFGGNSNWRGPVWFPLNLLAVESLRALHRVLGDDFTIELPTGSGRMAHLGAAADEIERRLVGLFLKGADGRRPADGPSPLFKPGSAWTERPLFYEYFNGGDRRRPRRLAPDRMDRARRVPDRPPRARRLTGPALKRAHRQPSAGATWVRIASITWAL